MHRWGALRSSQNGICDDRRLRPCEESSADLGRKQLSRCLLLIIAACLGFGQWAARATKWLAVEVEGTKEERCPEVSCDFRSCCPRSWTLHARDNGAVDCYKLKDHLQ